VVLEIEFLREDYPLKRLSNKIRRDVHLNRCINCYSETQEIWKTRQMTPSKIQNSSITESKNIKMVEIVNKECKV
jgi:hypothetical protein